MRAIFLDFDGVLHPADAPPGRGLPFEWIDELAAALAEHADVAVVVHSSWRSVFSIEELQEFLRPLGQRLIAVVGKGTKAEAVKSYLQAHPEIADFIVLDDHGEEFAGDLKKHLLECNSSTGISDSGVRSNLSAWLNGQLTRG